MIRGLRFTTKGGPDSGHHGHAGRPGSVGGSALGGEVISAMQEFEDRLKKIKDREIHGIFSADGNKLQEVEGSEGAVTVDAKLLDSLGGDYIEAHNHPNNAGPSAYDYDFWLRFQPKEARIITKDKTYILTPREGRWFPGLDPKSLYGSGASYYFSRRFYDSIGSTYPKDQQTRALNVLNEFRKEGWLSYEVKI